LPADGHSIIAITPRHCRFHFRHYATH
jgi:hypothetical protein